MTSELIVCVFIMPPILGVLNNNVTVRILSVAGNHNVNPIQVLT